MQRACLQSLKIQGLRNISIAQISQFSRINLFYGANGAGKTTVLEAIHLLALGRSFRGAKSKPLINYDCQEAVVFGELDPGFAGVTQSKVSVGVRKQRNGANDIRVAGQRIHSVAELAALLPLQVINADTFQLLLGSPTLRRQFVDWGVFHVEHDFLDQWRRLQRCLKQRNSLLRRGKIDLQELEPWDFELVQLAISITRSREKYFCAWQSVLATMLVRLLPEAGNLELSLYPGWDSRQDYGELLFRQLEVDNKRGYTGAGPHRADIKVKLNGIAVVDVLSRGQLKLLSASMRLAQAEVLKLIQKKSCIFLVDDLSSELDTGKSNILCEVLSDLGCQVFVTSIANQGLTTSCFHQAGLEVFHVEQGTLNQQ